MAFTVETGSGEDGANAYIDEEFFAAYHGDRGRDISDFTESQIQQAIVKATDFIEQRFSRKFRGYRLLRDQGLSWPRLGAFDDAGYAWSNQVPTQIMNATAEYALIVLRLVGAELLPNPASPFATVNESTGAVIGGVSGQVVRTFDKVGTLEQEREYAKYDSSKSSVPSKSSLVDDMYIPVYPRADLWIQETLVSQTTFRFGRGD